MEAASRYGLGLLGGLIAAGGLFAPEGYALAAFLLGCLLICAQLVLTDVRRGILATALLCFGSNAYLLARKLESSGDAACKINEVINCDVVNQSEASMLFGLPVTLFGIALYLGWAVATLTPEQKERHLERITVLFASLSLVFSAYLAYESKKLGAVCMVCITIYIGNALLLWAGLRGLRKGEQPVLGEIPSTALSIPMISVVAIFLFVTLIGGSAWQGQARAGSVIPVAADGENLTPEQLLTFYGKPQGEVVLAGDEPIYGDANAPITILEFADYGCPHCAHAAGELKKLVDAYPQVQLKFRAFALSGACNPAIENPAGAERCKAAMATECANKQGKFWALSNMIFKNQGYLDDASLAFMANDAGLDRAQYEACMADPTTAELVRADGIAGANAGVGGTPTLYMRGLVGDQWVEVLPSNDRIEPLLKAKADGVVLLPPPAPFPPR